MKLTLGFSPCPNDTFIFDALVNGKIDTGDFEFDVHLEDVQTLNEWALQSMLDVTKVSYGVLPLILDRYTLLESGGALGKGVGPLLIGNKQGITEEDIRTGIIAIPGENTTAHILFSLAYPSVTNKKFMLFSEIEAAVLNNSVTAGVIIHENRFTYQQKGLVKVRDLGEYWESTTGHPIPLGGIVMRKTLAPSLQQQVDQLIRNSLAYAFEQYPLITGYVKQHSQEMSETVMRQHIDLYVNDYSLGLGAAGHAAVEKFMEVHQQTQAEKRSAIPR